MKQSAAFHGKGKQRIFCTHAPLFDIIPVNRKFLPQLFPVLNKKTKTLSKKYSTLQTSPADPVVCFSHLKTNVKQKEETNYEKENRGTRSRNST